MIYVPDNLLYDSCYSFVDSNTLRIYDRVPQLELGANYVDVYINSHYLVSQSNAISFIQTQPVCLSSDKITHNWIYRNDLADILTSVACLSIFIYIIIFMPIKAFFKGGNR